MNSEETGYEEEESSIPPPDTTPEDDDDVSEEQMMLDDLKNRATTLGLKFHPSIGYEKLREKVNAAMEDVKPSVEKEPESTGAKGPADHKREALKLVRVRITNMDPMKKNHQGDLFMTGNSVIGTVKRFVPYGVEWHVPQIILNMIEEKKFQQFSTSKNSRNVDITTSKLVKTYAIERLNPLSDKELKELGRVQAMKRGEAND